MVYRNEAMDRVKTDMQKVVFSGTEFRSPIVYTFFYIQWEANKVRFTRYKSLVFFRIIFSSLKNVSFS